MRIGFSHIMVPNYGPMPVISPGSAVPPVYAALSSSHVNEGVVAQFNNPINPAI